MYTIGIAKLMCTIGIAKLMCTIGIAKLEQTVTHYPTILLVFIAHLYLPIWILFWQSALYNAPYTALIRCKIGHYDA